MNYSRLVFRLMVIGLLANNVAVAAEPYESGMELLLAGKASEAAAQFRAGAEADDGKSQYYLGLLYYHGRGVEQDARKAEGWWQKAAKNRNSDAMYSLYTLYIHQNSDPQHFAGILWYLVEASKAGHKEAERDLGSLYFMARGFQPTTKLNKDILWAGMEEPVEEKNARVGKRIYEANCAACHGPGVAGAPKAKAKAEWEERLKQGHKVLVRHAIKGFSGKRGFMPAKGGNASLKDGEVAAAVSYMTKFE